MFFVDFCQFLSILTDFGPPAQNGRFSRKNPRKHGTVQNAGIFDLGLKPSNPKKQPICAKNANFLGKNIRQWKSEKMDKNYENFTQKYCILHIEIALSWSVDGGSVAS